MTTFTQDLAAAAACASLLLACGDDGRETDSASGSETVAATVATTAGPTSTGGSESATAGSTDNSGTNGQTAGTTSTGASSGSTGATSDASAGTTTGTTGETTMGVSESDSDSSSTGEPCQGGGVGDIDSFIWIANSSEGTLSKIDTETGVELGRYIARPDGAGSPSRTSVSTSGAVAVANRAGGVTVYHANIEDCVESNGVPEIQTSTGGGDIRPWGEDECLAWHTPLPYTDNRPVAWTSGFVNPQTCEVEDRNVWTSGSSWALGTAEVVLLDGDDGAIINTIPIPDLPAAWGGNWFGFYGGAVDAENNFWATQLQGGKLIRVSSFDYSYQLWDVPAQGPGGYGMTITPDGYVWLTGRWTHRFDPETETWTSAQLFPDDAGVHTGGCMGDGQGILYRGSYSQIHGIDTETLEIVKTFDVGVDGDDHIWGVAVDFEGYVWGVPRNGSRAYKIDAATGQKVLTFEGLVGAYTYSDMTGFALNQLIPG